MASWPQGSAKDAAACAGYRGDVDYDWEPIPKWHDAATHYLIRFDLPGNPNPNINCTSSYLMKSKKEKISNVS